ncbi:MAG: hypothetical protein M3R09_02505 [Actinomycetota bacterium]|nr:hypothetical protein [Actinomycetota bacterium]
MYASRTTTDCKHCGMAAAECQTRNLTGEAGRCCSRCRPWHRAHRQRTERRDLPEPEPAAPVTSTPPEVTDRADEDRAVEAVLEAAKAEDDAGGVAEEYDRPGVGAYRALAKSRDVALETVVRHALRGTLADVVRMSPVATDPPDLATAGPSSTDEGDRP